MFSGLFLYKLASCPSGRDHTLLLIDILCKFSFLKRKICSIGIEIFRRGPTFIPRAPRPGGVGAGLGGGSSAGGLAGLIGGLAVPLLCLGCLASLALVGLFATMIGAAAYMST